MQALRLQSTVLVIALAISVAACSNPKDTILPTQIEKMESIKPAIEKLTQEERELLAGYTMRHTVGAAMNGFFGVNETQIPENMTLGKAIDEQRNIIATRKTKEDEENAAAAKLKSEREQAMASMRADVTVTLVDKDKKENRGYSGIVTDEHLTITLTYKNNTSKDVAGVKGTLSIIDLFGDEICAFNISNDTTIKAGESISWEGSRSIRYSMSSSKDQKCATVQEGKYKTEWKPIAVVFFEGGKSPEQPAEPAKPPESFTADNEALMFIVKSKNCLACHSIDRKIVGPAYKSVADRYRGRKNAIETLANKIKNGGKGEWGMIPMPPNQVSPDEARSLAGWVMSLN